MNITEKFSYVRSQYKNIVDHLKFNDKSIMIIQGSSSYKVNEYYSDIDLITDVKNMINDDEKTFDRFKEICEYFDNHNDYEFIEFKIQTETDKKKWNTLNQFNFETFKKYDDVSFYKIDLICYVNFRYIEVSCIYSNEEEKEVVESLNEDIENYIEEGKYYKALKRTYSKYAEDPDKYSKELVELQEFFNGEYGTYYNISSNLDTIMKLIEYKEKNKELTNQVIDRIETNLKYIFVSPNIDDIPKNYKKYITLANKGAKKELIKIYSQL